MARPSSRIVLAGLLAAVALAPLSARAQGQPAEVYVVHETRPGPAVPAKLALAGWRGAWAVVSTPGGEIAVDPRTGEGAWVDATVPDPIPWGDGAVFLANNGVWFESAESSRAPSEVRPLAMTTRWNLGQLTVAGDRLFVVGTRADGRALLEVVDDELRWVRDLGRRSVIATDGSDLWLWSETSEAPLVGELVRRGPGGAETVVRTGVVALLGVGTVAERTVVALSDGVYVVGAAGGLARLVPPEVTASSPIPVEPMLGAEDRLWVDLGPWTVATDGTAEGTTWFQAKGSVVGAIGGDYAAVRSGASVAIVDVDGEVQASVPNAADVLALGEAFLIASPRVQDPDVEGWDMLRFGAAGELEAVGQLRGDAVAFGGPVRPPWQAERFGAGALALDQPQGEVARFVRFDAEGVEVRRRDVTFGELEGELRAVVPFGERTSFSGPQPLAALDSGEVVVAPRGLGRPGFWIVDPEAPTVKLERSESFFVSSDGGAAYWHGGVEPVSPDDPGGVRVHRWRSSGGSAQLGDLASNAVLRSGVGGRPFASHILSRLWGDPLLQVDADDAIEEVFPDARGSGRGYWVDAAGMWIVEARAGTWAVSRWNFDAAAPDTLGAVDQDEEAPFWGPNVWVLGESPTPWVGTLAADGSVLRLRRVDGSREDVELTNGAVDGPLQLVPRERPRAIERLGRIFAQSEGTVRPVDGLTRMTEGVHASFGMVFAARETAGGEYEGAGSRDTFGGPSPFGSWVGREPWVLADDGTVRLVGDLFPGPEGSNPGGFARLPGGGVVFHAMTPDRGRELWFLGAEGDAQPVCELSEGPAPGIPVWAEIEVGPRALFVPAFVEGVGTEVVSIPLEAAQSGARCSVVRRLAEAESGCGCRTAGGVSTSATWGLLLMGLLFGARRAWPVPCRGTN